MDARLRFQFLLSVLLVVLFIEFYNNVGPEVELLSTYLFLLGSQQGNLSAKLAGKGSPQNRFSVKVGNLAQPA